MKEKSLYLCSCLALTALWLVVTLSYSEEKFTSDLVIPMLLGMGFVVSFSAIFFIPLFIARNKEVNAYKVLLMNFLLGVTVIGWAVTLVYVLNQKDKTSKRKSKPSLKRVVFK